MTVQAVSIARQAESVEQVILGKRNSLERFSGVRKKWPDSELDRLRVSITELEAAHATLLGLCGRNLGSETAAQ